MMSNSEARKRQAPAPAPSPEVIEKAVEAGGRAYAEGGYAEAEAERAYQRGMVEGARQVRDAVEERVALWPSMAGRTDYREGVSQATAALLTDAREAVALIEKGAGA